MIAVTILLLVTFFALLPLKICVNFCLDINQKCLDLRAKLFALPVFRENLQILGRYLVCSGTVETQLDLSATKGAGLGLAKAIAVDAVEINFALNYGKLSPNTMLAVEGFCFAASAVGCAATNTKLHVATMFSPVHSVCGRVKVEVTLAEILIALCKK